MRDNHLYCTSPALEECKKRFEKTRSRMVYHAICGAWGSFPTSRIVNNGITMPRLRLVNRLRKRYCNSH